MNFESDLIQYYVNKHEDIKEYYYLYEKLENHHIDLILKNMNADIATVFRELGYTNKADLIFGCDSLKYLRQCLAHEEHKDYIRSFCKDRYCPICSHIKSHKQTQMLHQLIASMQKDNNYKNCYLLFVTLTFKSVSSEELTDSVDKMIKAISKMLKQDKLFKSFTTKRKNSKGEVVTKKHKPLCIGTIRNIENTSKFKDGHIIHHPHTHMLLLVRKDYWNQKDKQWTNKKLQKAWRKYMELDYDPIVHITLVKDYDMKQVNDDLVRTEEQLLNSKECKKNNLSSLNPTGALKEISKYETKDSDKLQVYKDENGQLSINWSNAKIVINDLYKAFHRKRTLVFTGEFKKQKERLFNKKEVEDLIDEVNESEMIDIFKNKLCRKCGAETKADLLRYSGKTGAYYSIGSKENIEGFEKNINDKIIASIKKRNKKTDVNNHENISTE